MLELAEFGTGSERGFGGDIRRLVALEFYGAFDMRTRTKPQGVTLGVDTASHGARNAGALAHHQQITADVAVNGQAVDEGRNTATNFPGGIYGDGFGKGEHVLWRRCR